MKWSDETLGEVLRALPPVPGHLLARVKDLPAYVEGDPDGSDPHEDAGPDLAVDHPLGFEDDAPTDEFEPSSGHDDAPSSPEEV